MVPLLMERKPEICCYFTNSSITAYTPRSPMFHPTELPRREQNAVLSLEESNVMWRKHLERCINCRAQKISAWNRGRRISRQSRHLEIESEGIQNPAFYTPRQKSMDRRVPGKLKCKLLEVKSLVFKFCFLPSRQTVGTPEMQSRRLTSEGEGLNGTKPGPSF